MVPGVLRERMGAAKMKRQKPTHYGVHMVLNPNLIISINGVPPIHVPERRGHRAQLPAKGSFIHGIGTVPNLQQNVMQTEKNGHEMALTVRNTRDQHRNRLRQKASN